jgi:hypothetical protein
MDLLDRFKQNLQLPDSEMTTPEPSPLVQEQMTTTSSTWTTFLESMETAKQKAADMFTAAPEGSKVAPSISPPHVSTDSTAASSSTDVSTAVKGWWTDATAFFEETKISMEEKIAEMTGPVEMKNDPLKNLRLLLVSYTNALEQLKAEAFNFGMGAENMTRMGNQMLSRSLLEPFGESGTVVEQFGVYKERYTSLVLPALDEVRAGVENITQLVGDEVGKIQALQTRFKRRDRLHQSLSDMHARVNIKREKNNRRLQDGLPVDSQQMEELYELSRTADSIESDFRLTSEQLVAKCQEVLGNRSRTFQKIFTKLVEVQNTFFYRVSSTCSIPFQELHEAMRADIPTADEIDEIASLTWRSDVGNLPVREEEYMPMKTSPSRRATMSFESPKNAGGLTATAAAALNASGPSSPAARYSYSKPVRRAGTSALLEESAPSPK